MQPTPLPRKVRERVVDKKGILEMHDGTQVAGRITISEDYTSIHLQNASGTSSYPSYMIKLIRWPIEAHA